MLWIKLSLIISQLFFLLPQTDAVEPSSQLIVTNPRRSDGFGAQFQTVIYSILFAEINHRPFLYTPIQTIEHNYEQDPAFLDRLETLMNLRDYYPLNENLLLQEDSSHEMVHFFESHLSECLKTESLKRIKTLFRINKDRDLFFSPDQFHIAIHIRRSNPHDSFVLTPEIPNSFYWRIMDQLRNKYKDKNPLFHLFSQGDESGFKDVFLDKDVILHINSSLEDAFTSMVLADLLVTAASSLSYTAGILSDGIVYYLPFWHPPLPGWKIVNYFLTSGHPPIPDWIGF